MQIKGTAVVRLYVTPPNGIVWKFTNVIGVLAVMNDNNVKGHFLRIVDIRVCNLTDLVGNECILIFT